MKRIVLFFCAVLSAFFLFAGSVVVAQSLRSDFTGNGVVDIDDYSAYVAAFTQEFGRQTKSGSPAVPSATTSPSSESGRNPAVNVTDANLVAYFPFEETSSVVVNRKSGTGVSSLIPQGSPTYGAEGKFGRAVQVSPTSFFCSGSNTTCADNNALDFSGDFSISVWVRFSQTPSNSVIAKKWQQESGSYAFSVQNASTVLLSLAHPQPDYLGGYDNGAYKGAPIGRSFRAASASFSPNTWYHFVFVRQATAKTYDVYINGERRETSVGQITQASGGKIDSVMRADNQNSPDPFVVGQFSGLIDDLAVYKTALDQNMIQKLYAGQAQ